MHKVYARALKLAIGLMHAALSFAATESPSTWRLSVGSQQVSDHRMLLCPAVWGFVLKSLDVEPSLWQHETQGWAPCGVAQAGGCRVVHLQRATHHLPLHVNAVNGAMAPGSVCAVPWCAAQAARWASGAHCARCRLQMSQGYGSSFHFKGNQAVPCSNYQMFSVLGSTESRCRRAAPEGLQPETHYKGTQQLRSCVECSRQLQWIQGSVIPQAAHVLRIRGFARRTARSILQRLVCVLHPQCHRVHPQQLPKPQYGV